jgi:single-strand DNA-binding protein
MIEGRMQTRSWDDAGTGTKKYRTEIIADRVQFGSSGAPGGSSSAPRAATSTQSGPQSQDDELDTIEYPDEQINAEDIPF